MQRNRHISPYLLVVLATIVWSTSGVFVRILDMSPGMLSFFLFFSALKYISSVSASLISYLEVLGASCLGLLLFNETLSWNLILGGSMIMLSIIFIKR